MISDDIEEERASKIFEDVNAKLIELGKSKNEPVGTIKLLHSVAPYFFPLLDNPMAKAIGLKKRYEILSLSHYLSWMEGIKIWLSEYSDMIEEVEKELKQSILKSIDQGFYIMSSINLSLRMKRLGLDLSKEDHESTAGKGEE